MKIKRYINRRVLWLSFSILLGAALGISVGIGLGIAFNRRGIEAFGYGALLAIVGAWLGFALWLESERPI
jgi:hypothetical protein